MAVYLEKLLKYDVDVLTFAIDAVLEKGDRFPTIGMIVSEAEEHKRVKSAWQENTADHMLEDKGDEMRVVKFQRTTKTEEKEQLMRRKSVKKRYEVKQWK